VTVNILQFYDTVCGTSWRPFATENTTPDSAKRLSTLVRQGREATIDEGTASKPKFNAFLVVNMGLEQCGLPSTLFSGD
jgi:hypothetical protein